VLGANSSITNTKASSQVLSSDSTFVKEGYSLGDTTATAIILEFADYQCPVSKRFNEMTEHAVRDSLVKSGAAKFVFADFPKPKHPYAMLAATAAACADDQGSFWAFHDSLYTWQGSWQNSESPRSVFEQIAKDIGLNVSIWRHCVSNNLHAGR